jgi:outer membrane biosynthesis protein TonB
VKSVVFAIFICFVSSVVVFAQKGEVSADTFGEPTVSLPVPVYPEAALKIELQGSVTVRVTLDDKGSVTAAEASHLHPICASVVTPEILELQKVSAESAKNAKFPSPSTSTTKLIRYTFKLLERKPENAGDRKSFSGGVRNGKALSLPKPSYPAAAKAVKAKGAVTVSILITEDGSVYSAEAVSGHPLLRASSEIAACSARFEPTLIFYPGSSEGKPVKVAGFVTYNYNY